MAETVARIVRMSIRPIVPEPPRTTELRVQGGRAAVDVADLVAQVGWREHLGVVAPGDAPQPDLDRAAHDGSPLQRTVGQSLGPLVGVPRGPEDAIGDG